MDTFQTHGSSMDFLEVHGRLQHAVLHVHECNAKDGLSNLNLPLGKCAAMLYLMGVSGTPKTDFEDSTKDTLDVPSVEAYWRNRSEDNLDFKSLWDLSCRFWTEMGKAGGEDAAVASHSECAEVLAAFNSLTSMDAMEGDADARKDKERWAIVCRAWNKFASTGLVGTAFEIGVKPEDYQTSAKDKRAFIARDTVGGIDLGDRAVDPKMLASEGGGDGDVVLSKAEQKEQQSSSRRRSGSRRRRRTRPSGRWNWKR